MTFEIAGFARRSTYWWRIKSAAIFHSLK